MKIKLFWKENCPKCPLDKTLVGQFKETEFYNIDTPEGLAEATFYGVMSTPSIIVIDETGKEVASWCGDVPTFEEVKKWLN